MGKTKIMPQLDAPSAKGKPLVGPLRHELESAFNRDFSQVRVHEGHEAVHLGVKAFVNNQDIYFAPGQTPPPTAAHEAWHVVQQTQGTTGWQAGPQNIPEPLAEGLVDLSNSAGSNYDNGLLYAEDNGGSNYGGNNSSYGSNY
ncbi:MAG TPA: DUF4157 domain-containing protein [Pyrinomonadaceae bacterium]|nr:DUF4157 domain-containing protein [Pyrinomonadaceae bacterium]